MIRDGLIRVRMQQAMASSVLELQQVVVTSVAMWTQMVSLLSVVGWLAQTSPSDRLPNTMKSLPKALSHWPIQDCTRNRIEASSIRSRE